MLWLAVIIGSRRSSRFKYSLNSSLYFISSKLVLYLDNLFLDDFCVDKMYCFGSC